DLVQIACELNDDELQGVRYGPFSQKLSPILRDPQLRKFLSHLMKLAQGSLTVGTIIDVMRFRFSLPTEEHTELDENYHCPNPSNGNEGARGSAASGVISPVADEYVLRFRAYFRSCCDFDEAC